MLKRRIFRIVDFLLGRCWNCHGLGLIPLDNESDPDSESFVYGELCPICHGDEQKTRVNLTRSRQFVLVIAFIPNQNGFEISVLWWKLAVYRN